MVLSRRNSLPDTGERDPAVELQVKVARAAATQVSEARMTDPSGHVCVAGGRAGAPQLSLARMTDPSGQVCVAGGAAMSASIIAPIIVAVPSPVPPQRYAAAGRRTRG